MKIIKILGTTGCAKSKIMFDNVNQALKNKGLKAKVVKVEDVVDIMKYDVMSTPALVIDEEVKLKGKLGNVKEIESLF